MIGKIFFSPDFFSSLLEHKAREVLSSFFFAQVQ